MKLIKINHKDRESADSIVERKSYFGNECDEQILSQGETVWHTFRPFRQRRARVIRFIYEDQWGDLITVNGKTMTQREYLVRQGNVALQANLMASKANSIIGAHIKEGSIPSVHARARSQQVLGEILSESLHANWEYNDMKQIEVLCEQELLFGGMAVIKESYERVDGILDAHTRVVNPNMFGFSSSMQDPRLKDISMTVELHDYTFNELCAAFVESPEDFKKLREWFNSKESPLRYNDLIEVDEKLDESRLDFYSPVDTKNCRVIEMWTKERRPRWHMRDWQTGEMFDINADDEALIRDIKKTNESRMAEGRRLGYSDEEIPLIEFVEYFIDTFWYYRFLTPKGFILREGESELPDRTMPYSICAVPFVNGKICGHMYDAVDLQLAVNRELTLYDWMKRLGTKGVTFVPQNIIPDGMSYGEFAEQWTSMDGIVFYKPNASGEKPFTEHSSLGHLNTAEMVKMLSDTMAESVSVSGAIQGKTPYAGTSAQLYAQQLESSTTPIAFIASKLEYLIKHAAMKKVEFIKEYYNIDQYAEVADDMNLPDDIQSLALDDMHTLKYKFKYVIGSDHTTLRSETNELLLSMLQMQALTAADVLELGEFANGDNIVARMNERAIQMAQQQQIGGDYEQKKAMMQGNTGQNA